MIRIIPAIDILEGKCVRLEQGDYSKGKIYSSNPLEVAKNFEDHGIQYLHLVDLDGARSSKVVNWKVLENIVSKTNLKIDFGGGVKSTADIDIVFNCGANQVTGGSIAVNDAEMFLKWLSTYGDDKIILGADAKYEKIAVNGWNEETNKNVFDFIYEYFLKGITYCVCTDISKDGMLQGPSTKLYQQILTKAPTLKLIASGGVSTINDIVELEKIGAEGVIIGKALYENKISLTDIQNYILAC